MKTKLLLIVLFTFSFLLSPCKAQVPQGFNYQAIARDGSGNPITGATMQVKIGILSDTIVNTMVWEELFNPVKTNAFGMFTIVVGTGVKQSGSATTFSAIDWTKTPLFLRTSIYYPSSWKVMGTTKLQSVPYSMVAGNLEGTVPLLSVKGNTTTMDSALFVVRNNTGQIVFAVYNEGVRIYVDDGVAKGATKGGFAIGSFNKSKGTSQTLFVVDPDSIRAYIDTGLVKSRKGGFAIGSFDKSKSGSQQFFQVTHDSIRMYINDSPSKAVKGGFAIGGFDKSKGSNTQYLRVTHDSTRIITADTLKGFGVSNLLSGNTLGYLRLTPSNYFIGHQAGHAITSGLYNSVIGYRAGYNINTGNSNSFIGYIAGFSNLTGNYNTFVGDSSGYSNLIGSSNTFLGGRAGFNNTASFNTFIGSQSGYNNSSGEYNTFLGTRSGFKNTTGMYNTFAGNYSGNYNSTANDNTFFGYAAGYLNSTGSYNTYIGKTAGYNNVSGNYNTFIGQCAGSKNTSDYNVYIGMHAGFSNTSGYSNVFIGSYAGSSNITGYGNVFIGDGAGYSETGSYKLYIDPLRNSSSGALIYGEFDNKILRFNGSVGIGIYPIHLIHLSGGAYSDGATWTNASDKNLKENFETVNGEEILGLINKLPVTKWNYKAEDPGVKHIGPVAQDFYSLFGLGNDDKSISSIDPSGIALVAIKELSSQNKMMKELIESQQKEIYNLKTLVNTLVANQTGQGNK